MCHCHIRIRGLTAWGAKTVVLMPGVSAKAFGLGEGGLRGEIKVDILWLCIKYATERKTLKLWRFLE